MDKELSIGFMIDNIEDKTNNGLHQGVWAKNGENLVSFKELG